MKLRVLFLKKYHILYLAAITLICSFILSAFTGDKSSSTFNMIVNDSKAIKADLTGDGMEDILYIKTEKDKYYIQVNSGNESYYLEPGRKLNSTGYYYPYWPMKISLMDISRDRVPEIFVQASQKDKPIQHIFLWDGREFKDIYCSTNNIFGVIDSQSNKTPKIISGNLVNSKLNFASYMFFNGNLQNINYSSEDIIPGKDAVLGFIKYIETLPEGESYKPLEVFYPGLTGKDLTAIGKMCGENNIYSFQDAIFMDTKVNKDGDITEIKWTLNFRATSKNLSDQIKNYSVIIKLKPDSTCSDRCFKIFNISLG
jgi:hypothetical protein